MLREINRLSHRFILGMEEGGKRSMPLEEKEMEKLPMKE